MHKPRLQIIRGLPGTGKSTLALRNFPSLFRIETDMYFTRKGRYTFSKELNRRAVEWFHGEINACLCGGMDFVVTGVFAAHTERLTRTINAALAMGYEVYIKTLTKNYGNVHNVPKAHFDAMQKDFLSEESLKTLYKGNRRVHFGLMDGHVAVGGRIFPKNKKNQSAAEGIAQLCGDYSIVSDVENIRKRESRRISNARRS